MSELTDYWSGFLSGAFVAFIVALILDWLRRLIKGYITSIQAADKPQNVVHPTSKTPNEVVQAASQARRKVAFLYVMIWIILVIVLEFFRPGTIQDVIALFGQ